MQTEDTKLFSSGTEIISVRFSATHTHAFNYSDMLKLDGAAVELCKVT